MTDINPQIINAEIAQIGPQGIPGQAATISIGSVTTGAAGSSATVTNSGTPNAAILDFVIPQGAKGAQGEQGQQGIQGLTGATGNGISGIAKIGTSGLVDTYRISLTDNTHFDFTVTNGSSISDIEKTGTSGLVDTYTITLTNGDTHTFTVTNGAEGEKGETGDVGNGILNILKMSTTGLVDNYRINFTNGTYFDFDVTNALSIQSIAKLSTSGLVDTYRITFNDSTYFDFPVTNGRGVTGVTLLSWEGLDKTYRMSFNDGTYFDYVVTNGTGQVDWGGISGILSQQADLQDALVQSNGLTTGSVSTYNVMLDELIERAHSTFDKSKFTVVGSPVITDDGIASEFSSNNYLNCGSFNFKSGTAFTIPFAFKCPSVTASDNRMILSCNGFGLYLNVGTTGRVSFHTGGASASTETTDIIEANVLYQGVCIYDGNTTITLKIKRTTDNNYITINATTTETFDLSSSDLIIGKISTGDWHFIGSIDLKQFSITVDGVEVFSGNKTGIDTIKPDDYSIIGTPTISADGIASGFSSGNLLRIPYTYFNNKVKIRCGFYWDGVTSIKNKALYRLPRNQWTNVLVGRSLDDSTICFYLATGSSSTAVKNFIYTLPSAGSYIVSIEFTGTQYIFEVYQDGNLVYTDAYASTENFYYSSSTIDFLTIGGNADYGYYPNSIDLNAFKIYVDGDLVYQPCLKIPYTESKTGSKIVDSVYRDRVNDMAEQFGYANYYTLDEDNGNFTLPQVELYGLIGDKTLRDSYYNGVTYWELFSNRRLEQGGTCESGVEYTLPKPFVDANYVLTIPYSSKTASSFIPSATGDFIAKGVGIL